MLDKLGTMTDAILAAIILLPLIVTFLMKSNAALGLLALLAGYSVETLTGTDVSNIVDKLKLSGVSTVDIDLLMIALPLFLTLIFTARSVGARSRLPLQLLAALASGGILVILTSPFINALVDINIYTSKIWPAIQHIQAPIIALGSLYSLILVWAPKHKSLDKKHK